MRRTGNAIREVRGGAEDGHGGFCCRRHGGGRIPTPACKGLEDGNRAPSGRCSLGRWGSSWILQPSELKTEVERRVTEGNPGPVVPE